MTPAEARKLLGWRTPEAVFSRKKGHCARRYQRMMLDGTWRDDGPPIYMDMDGEMLDGANRLAALATLDFDVPLRVEYTDKGKKWAQKQARRWYR